MPRECECRSCNLEANEVWMISKQEEPAYLQRHRSIGRETELPSGECIWHTVQHPPGTLTDDDEIRRWAAQCNSMRRLAENRAWSTEWRDRRQRFYAADVPWPAPRDFAAPAGRVTLMAVLPGED